MCISNLRVASIFVPIFSLFVFGCGHSKTTDQNRSLMIGFDDNYNVKVSYDGSGWNQISKWLTSVRTNEDAPFNISLLAGYDFSKLTTNHNDIWIRGTLLPMDTNWDYVMWNLKVTTINPLEVVCYGFQNTNNIETVARMLATSHAVFCRPATFSICNAAM